jgi:hypothetical protein
MLEEKKSTTESASSSTFSPKEFDASTEIAAFWDKPTNVLNQILDVIGNAIGPESLGKAVADLDQKSAALIQTLGVGNKRGQELTLTIADTIPKYLELGLKADDAAADYVKLIDNELTGNYISLDCSGWYFENSIRKCTAIEISQESLRYRNDIIFEYDYDVWRPTYLNSDPVLAYFSTYFKGFLNFIEKD